MARLEDLSIGSAVNGLLSGEPITVVSTKWYGSSCMEVFYKTNQGTTGSQILYRDDEVSLTLLEKSLPWSFDVEGEKLRLVSEAYRIHLAHLFDPYLAVHTSAIEPLPHQISAVYEEMLPRLPLRYVLADDPGAGKTIMTGLLLKELIIRGDLKRCMIVSPGNLAEQWQDELFQKFHLRFEILTNDRLESAVTGNVFTEVNYCIVRLDKLSRNTDLQEKLKVTDWDLIVCDEAHKMSATMWGGEVKYTKRYQLGRLLSGISRHFLLLTATPHNGKEEDFQLFMSLVDPDIEAGTKNRNAKGRATKAVFCCPKCGSGVVHGEYADQEAEAGRMGVVPVCKVVEGKKGRIYQEFSPEEARSIRAEVNNYFESHDLNNIVPHAQCRGTFASNAQGRYYGFHEFKDYFTPRQLTALTTFSELVGEAQKKAEADTVAAGCFNDHIALSEGGTGARAYGEAVGVYLAFVVDKMTDYHSSICSWNPPRDGLRNTFGRQAIPMVWDFAEGNPFSNSSGCWDNMIEWIFKCLLEMPINPIQGIAKQFDAQSDSGLRNIAVSTDPPYYDNIGYADLSDYFYVWMRQALKDTYPKVFRTMLVPKTEELVATPYRFEGSVEKARDFFEDGMFNTCCRLYQYAREDIPVTIYYAFKQSETDADDSTASTGWETMLSAIIRSGFTITGTWPMRTEMANRSIASGANALASSIVLVCRKRAENARSVTRREFINALHREMRPALEKLQSANIAPVDLAQSAIGPGIGVFSRFKSVLEADGAPMSVRAALQIINQELDAFYNEQEGELDRESRFCVDLFNQYAFNNIKFGDADILARAKNTSVQALADRGVLSAAKGQVRLLTREEISEKVDAAEECTWLLTQQLARAMEKGGVKECAQIVVGLFGSNAENAKALAYRLYTICERKNWAQEGYAYNNLVVAWPDIQTMAAAIHAERPEQMTMDI